MFLIYKYIIIIYNIIILTKFRNKNGGGQKLMEVKIGESSFYAQISKP